MSAFAIDPGAAGGIAYYEDSWACCDSMPDTVVDLADKLRSLMLAGNQICILEEIPLHAGPNAAAMIKLGIRYGECRGILATLGIKVVTLPPKKWQAALGLGVKASHGARWKAHLKEKSQSLFPHLKVTLKLADALLILEAAKRLNLT